MRKFAEEYRLGEMMWSNLTATLLRQLRHPKEVITL